VHWLDSATASLYLGKLLRKLKLNCARVQTSDQNPFKKSGNISDKLDSFWIWVCPCWNNNLVRVLLPNLPSMQT